MNESDVLAVIRERVLTADPRVLMGPGDDLAQILVGEGSGSLLVGVDQVIDGLHVLADRVSWDRIGGKAMRRALSDVAAMAGHPLASLASVVLPPGALDDDITALCKGLHETAEAFHAPVVGGDVAIHRLTDHPLTVSVTVLATPRASGPVQRSGAREGDLLVVTGQLGGSLREDGGGHHLEFCPRISEAARLQEVFGKHLHAMIDISDGLGRDAGRLADAAGLQVQIDSDLLPLRDRASVAAAMGDGEDYELLMAVAADTVIPPNVPGTAPPCQLTTIGRFNALPTAEAHRVMLVDAVGPAVDASECGWDHGQ
ncbi:MAG: thiamine-phosphate kinase [Phycisphaerales bacterium]|nr:thiamine-phosphate kinase [Phycisphaerales bacterium]